MENLKRILTYEYCEKELKKYNTRIELMKNDPALYNKVRAKKWNELCSHFVRAKKNQKESGYWTYERCKEAALKCQTKSEFTDYYSGAKASAIKLGCYDEITSHMTSSMVVKGYWTYDRCKEIALKYKKREDLRKNNPSVLSVIYNNKWLELFDHMELKSNPSGYWTYERCKEAALKCQYKSEFNQLYSSAIAPARKNNWWDEITTHMDKKPHPRKYNTETAIEEAKKYKTRTEVLDESACLYRFLHENNLMDELFPTIVVENKKLKEEGKKRCKTCDQIYELSKFKLIKQTEPSKGHMASCIKCHTQNVKNYWHSIRESKLKPGGLEDKKKLWAQGKRKCTKCGEIKNIETDFYVRPDKKVQSKCRSCMHEYNAKRSPIKMFSVKWKIKLREEGKKWCNRCEQIKPLDDFGARKSNKIDGKSVFCKKCKSETDKAYRNDPRFKDKLLEKKKKYHEKIKDTEKYREYVKNRNSTRDYSKEYKKHISDEFRKFKTRIRGRINSYFKVNREWVRKDTKTIELLGADYFIVKEFIERQFSKGMSWDNYGSHWHIDHVIPLDAAGKDYEKAKRLCFYQNLSPMWGKDNLRKGWKVPQICALWENPIVPYKVNEIVIVPRYEGIVGDYKLQISPGQKYGRLTYIKDTAKKKNRRMVTCKCECGNIVDVSLNSLRQGQTRSCGCLHKEIIRNKLPR